MSDDDVRFVAAAIVIAKRHGMLTPTEVHLGMSGHTRPSKRNLTMRDDLIEAVAAAEKP